MIDTDKHEGSKGRYFTGKMVDNYMNLQAEVKRLREGIEKALIPTDTKPWIHHLVKLGDLRKALKELIE